MERNATHAGSWYTDDEKRLDEELELYLHEAVTKSQQHLPIKGVRAIIGPHAGFRYSGPTAAYAYKAIDTAKVKRIFLLGPSHHAYINGCSLSRFSSYETPLGSITIDREITEDLHSTGKFGWMSSSVDEEEHSLEMHLPFIYKTFEKNMDDIKLIPILVGSISPEKERMYGGLLAAYLDDPHSLFVISSDFCHWGSRFQYTYYSKSDKDSQPIQLRSSNKDSIERPIYQSIQSLDHQGIAAIESLSFDTFQSYLAKTRNTICGRHPIAVLMAAMEMMREKNAALKQTVKCIHYDQSSHCKKYSDSSVSYASLYLQIE